MHCSRYASSTLQYIIYCPYDKDIYIYIYILFTPKVMLPSDMQKSSPFNNKFPKIQLSQSLKGHLGSCKQDNKF